MAASNTDMASADLDEEQDIFELANLYPRTTGLPMTIWASPRGRAQHDARIKVCMAHGERMDPSNCAVVSIRPQPQLVHGTLPSSDLAAVQAWIALNAPVLLDDWDGTLDTLEFVQGLRRT